MKLIELLVQELPKHGGWPEGAETIIQDGYGTLRYKNYLNKHSIYTDVVLPVSSDYCLAGVTREQYEAVTQQPVWNGEGLPPVGCDVMFTIGPYDIDNDFSGILPSEGGIVQVVAHKVTTDGNDVAVVYWDDKGAGRSACFVRECFRPIRSEAEKKREEAKHAIAELCRSSASNGHSADLIYDAIAAGKIPHIQLK